MSRLFVDLILSALLAIVLFLGIDSVTARSFVDGSSMEPTLHGGQALLTSRLGLSGLTRQVYADTHQSETPAAVGWVPPRGSIVTFVHPQDASRLLVKRVVGLPGEELVINNGDVFINGEKLDEPYVVFHDKRSIPGLRVPLDSVFMLGDNRPASGDSRSFGPVPTANLVGVAILRYWPPAEFRLLLGGN